MYSSISYKFLPIVFFVFLVLLNCTPENPDGLPSHIQELDSLIVITEDESTRHNLTLEQKITFTDSLLLDEISAVEVDETGTVFIGGESWNRRNVHIFNSDGSFRDSLGRYGDDFGEFLKISRLQLISDTLLVFDPLLNRITTFQIKTDEALDTLGLNPGPDHLPDNWTGFSADPVIARSDGSWLMAFRRERDPAYEPEGEIRYYAVNNSSEVISGSLLVQSDIRYLVGDYAGRPAPFTLPIPEQPLLSISVNGQVYSAFTDEFLIQMHSTDGNHTVSYYYPFERFDLDPEEVIHPRFSHNNQLVMVRESAVYPGKWPALYSMLTDDEGRIWVSTLTESREELKWWVIDSRTGRVEATFLLPMEQPIRLVKNKSVYTVEKNNMGFKVVVKYAFDIQSEKSG